MVIPDEVRKCVAFLGVRLESGEHRLAGSVFWLGRDVEGTDKADSVYAVTARHVIDQIRGTGVEHVWFRMNDDSGGAVWLPSHLSEWYTHPTDSSLDVAIFKGAPPAGWDHRVVPYSMCATEERMKKDEVGLGDEVFITGLFSHHYGARRNIPIVRVGNVACLTEEKVHTRSFGLVDALLVEARSIGGLSGSPVFLNLGATRMLGGELVHLRGGKTKFYLLGLVHGHYDVEAGGVDSPTDDESEHQPVERVNTGIAIVVPIHSVREVIDEYEARGPADLSSR